MLPDNKRTDGQTYMQTNIPKCITLALISGARVTLLDCMTINHGCMKHAYCHIYA